MTIDIGISSLSDINLSGTNTAALNTETSKLSPHVLEGIEITSQGEDLVPSGPTLPKRNAFYFSCYTYGTGSTGTNHSWFKFYDLDASADIPAVAIRSDDNVTSNVKFNIAVWNGSTLVEQALSVNTVSLNALHRWDIEIFFDDAAGFINVLVDGTLLVSWTGDTNISSAAGINWWKVAGLGATISGKQIISGCMSGDEELRDIICVQNDTITTGATNTAASGDATDIDELGLNEGDKVIFDAAGQILDFTANLPTAYESGYDVVAHTFNVRANKGSTGPQSIALGYFISATEYVGSDQALDSGYSVRRHVAMTNPDTASAWTIGQVDGVTHRMKAAA